MCIILSTNIQSSILDKMLNTLEDLPGPGFQPSMMSRPRDYSKEILSLHKSAKNGKIYVNITLF
jgi:hypothetical protein